MAGRTLNARLPPREGGWELEPTPQGKASCFGGGRKDGWRPFHPPLLPPQPSLPLAGLGTSADPTALSEHTTRKAFSGLAGLGRP